MARILIVEDEQADRIILASILEGAGHEVYFASDGRHALKIYTKTSIDVVVTDLQMPYVDGLELIEALRALAPDEPIIAVSGKEPALLAAAKKQGVQATLSKPVEPRQLLEAVAAAAQGRPVAATRTVMMRHKMDQRLKILERLAG